MQPLIGITAGEIKNKDHTWSPITYGQSYTYVDAVCSAGGSPVIIPLLKDMHDLRRLYECLDGIVFAGGNDLAPQLYGEEPLSATKDVSSFRDSTEIQLMQWCLADGKPFIGICRGMQLLNVLLGGNLYQDIATQLPDSLDHDASTKKKTLVDTSHEIRIKPGSRLADALGTEAIGTNAHHHQAIRSLGKGLEAVAWSKDEIIEAIELPGAACVIGVQSHPESLEASAEPKWQELFKTLTKSAQEANLSKKRGYGAASFND